MLKSTKTDIFAILSILVIFLCILPFFFLHQGLFTIDTGRELYISQQVAQGNVLYKDILNIYGPFAYQLNALLFLIFGESINTLYIFGIVNSFFILTSIYLLAKEFLNTKYSLLITIITMFSLVFQTFLFNSNITYSYGLIYGLSTFLVSALFLIKYIKSEKVNYAYFSCIFAGISIINKYEFILHPLALLIVFLFLKPLKIKDIFKSFLCFISFPIISFAFLFVQGLTILDVTSAYNIMSTMAKSETMNHFYSLHGCFFDPKSYFKLITKSPIYTFFGMLPLINIILSLVFFKKLKQDKAKLILCIISVFAAFKFTIFLKIDHMGAFFFPLCFLTFFVLANEKFSKLFNYLFLSYLVIIFAYADFNSLKLKTHLLETPKGNVYTYSKDKMMMEIPINFIINNAKKDDKVLVVPEGAFINYATDKETDNQYINLDPLYYLDTFNEEEVINHFTTNNIMDYIVILPISTTEYGYRNFCSYAQRFCEMIDNEYKLVEEKDTIKIYERK